MKEENSILFRATTAQSFSISDDQDYLLLQLSERQKTIRNNMILVTVLNFISILSNMFLIFYNIFQSFSILFYQWYQVSQRGQSPKVWLSLFYFYSDETGDQQYFTFNSYVKAQQQLSCNDTSTQNNAFYQIVCKKQVFPLYISAIVTTALLIISLLVQVYDIIRLRKILMAFEQSVEISMNFKGSTIYFLIIFTKISALLLYFIILEYYYPPGSIYKILIDHILVWKFGVCYWLCFATCLASIIFTLYYKWQKGRYHRFFIMERLMSSDLQLMPIRDTKMLIELDE